MAIKELSFSDLQYVSGGDDMVSPNYCGVPSTSSDINTTMSDDVPAGTDILQGLVSNLAQALGLCDPAPAPSGNPADSSADTCEADAAC